jgi:TolB-like protein
VKHPAGLPSVELASALGDRYRIVEVAGRGGMGVVYHAFDSRHQRPVAIKTLDPQLATQIGRKRFLREISIVSSLIHPNILPIHDSGELAGLLYYVMPFVAEPSLRELLLERGPVSIGEMRRLLADVAAALDYAHARGVVHRDVKPANILLLSGRAVIADFGIASTIQAELDTLTDTSSRAYLGTPAYMSPEQRAHDVQVDGRSDIYSLGVVALELLTGSRTLPAAKGRMTDAQGQRVPPRVERAIRRATHDDPSERFTHAEEFVAALAEDRAWPRRLLVLFAVAVVCCTLAVWSAVRYFDQLAGPSRSEPARVVVGQFENRTAADSNERIGMMASDWITEGLQRTGVVNVVPSPTAMQASRVVRSSTRPMVVGLAQETGASIVITGSYYQVGDSLTIHVQVSDSTGRTQLGAITPVTTARGRVPHGIEQVRARLMGLLASRLDIRVQSAVSLTNEPPTFAAYLAYIDGLERYLANNFASASEAFMGSYRADTTLVAALLMASISMANTGDYARADSLLTTLAPRSARLSSHDRLWFLYRRALSDGNRPAALQAIRQLARTSPNTKATYNLAVEAMQNGELDEARRALLSLNPVSGPMRGWAPYWDVLGRIEHMRGDHTAELLAWERGRLAFPERPYLMLTAVRAFAAQGNTRMLVPLLQRARAMPPDPMGTDYGDLCFEATLELRAHGHRESRAIEDDCLAWSIVHPARSSAQRVAHARLLKLIGRGDDAMRLIALVESEAIEEVGTKMWRYLAELTAGDSAGARAAFARFSRSRTPSRMGAPTLGAARVAAALGESDRALVLIGRALQEGLELDLWVHRDPEFERLRRDPRYVALTTRRTP